MGKVIDVTLKLTDKLTSPLNMAGRSLANHSKQFLKAGRQIQNAGKNISSAGASMTKGLTVPIVAAGTACVKLAADFESGLDKVQSISGATGTEMDKLSEKAKEMGAKTKFSATEATDAFSYMAMAGWKTKDMMDGVEGVMTLAGATGEDLASVSDIVTDSLTSFGLSAKDTNSFVDTLAATASNSNTNVAMLGESFKYCAPVAGSLGYNVNDVSVALGLMANSGIKASSAGTAMRALMTNMAKPTKQSAQAMSDLGISLTDSNGKMKPFSKLMGEMRGSFSHLTTAQKAQYASMLAGKTGMSGLLAVVNSSDGDFNKLTDSINKSSGACKDMYTVAQDNLNGQLTILKSTVQSIAISFGEKLTPYVKKLTGFLQSLANKFNNLTDAQQNTIIKIALVAASIGPVLLVFGKMVTGVGKVVSVLGKVGRAFKLAGSLMGILTSPAGIVIGVIAAIALGALLIVKNWDKVKGTVLKVKEWFVQSFGGAGGAFEKFKKAFASIGKSLGSVAGMIASTLGKVIPPMISKLSGAFKAMLPIIQKVIQFLVNNLADGITVFAGFLQKAIPVVIQFGSKMVSAIAPAVNQVMKAIKTLIPILQKTFMKVLKSMQPVFHSFGSVIKKTAPIIAKTLGKALKVVAPLMSKVASVAGKIAKTLGGVLAKTIRKLGPIVQKVGNLFSIIFGKIASVVAKTFSKVAPFISKAMGLVSSLFDFCVPFVSVAVETIGGYISTGITFIGDVVGSLFDVFGGVIDFVTGVFTGNWSKAWNGVVSVFKGIINLIPAAFEGIINLVINAINGITGGINKVTGVVGIPEIPKIATVTLPRLAMGSQNWRGGLVQISERGGEIVDLPQGSRVYPHDKSVEMARKQGQKESKTGKAAPTIAITIPKLADSIIVREDSDIDKIVSKLANKLEKTALNLGGGDIGYSY